MNKASSKLAAGVRKVKAQQSPVPAAPKPARPKAARAEEGGVKTGQSSPVHDMHPPRVWPD